MTGAFIAHVYAEILISLHLVGVGNIADRQQVELVALLTVHQIAFALAVVKYGALLVANEVTHALATANSPDRHRLVAGLPRQDAVIVSDCAVRLEGRAVLRSGTAFGRGLLVNLVGVGHLGDTANHELGGQDSVSAHLLVEKMLYIITPKLFGRPRLLADAVAQSIACLKGLLEMGRLLWRRLKFDL